MWFAALEDPRRLQWFARFLKALLENQPAVLALMENNPFPDQPPRYVRAQFYDYRFSDSVEKASGRWWHRHLLGAYYPEVSLKGQ
jgi:hypothetical protein